MKYILIYLHWYLVTIQWLQLDSNSGLQDCQAEFLTNISTWPTNKLFKEIIQNSSSSNGNHILNVLVIPVTEDLHWINLTEQMIKILRILRPILSTFLGRGVMQQHLAQPNFKCWPVSKVSHMEGAARITRVRLARKLRNCHIITHFQILHSLIVLSI